jgi:hypothetical protein
MFGQPPVTKEYLQGLAQSATTDFLSNGTPLTEAVVKQASACGANLTSEHVRRICEMTYHDTYERMHKQASSADRYIVFDPPDANVAAEVLQAVKVASAPQRTPTYAGEYMSEKNAGVLSDLTTDPQGRTFSQRLKDNTTMSQREMFDMARENDRAGRSLGGKLMRTHMGTESKLAAAPGRRFKFQPANAFDQVVKTASTDHSGQFSQAQGLHDLKQIHDALKEASAQMDAEARAADSALTLARQELSKVAYSLVKEGASVEDILHAGFSGVKWESTSEDVAVKVASDLSNFLQGKERTTAGLRLSKIASAGDVNPDHPLPQAFAKVASIEERRVHLEIGLNQIKADLKYANDALVSTLFGEKSASVSGVIRGAKAIGRLAADHPVLATGAAVGAVGLGALAVKSKTKKLDPRDAPGGKN